MQRTIAEEMQAEGRRIGRKEGRREGELLARKETLLRQLRHRFGEVPDAVAAAVHACQDVAQLDRWLDNFATAGTLAEVGIGAR